jgi:hypothetical protein
MFTVLYCFKEVENNKLLTALKQTCVKHMVYIWVLLVLCNILKIIWIKKICLLTVTSFTFTECKTQWLGILNFMGKVYIDSKAWLLLLFRSLSYIHRRTKSYCVCFKWQLLAEVERIFVTFSWLPILISISQPFWVSPSLFTLYVKTP